MNVLQKEKFIPLDTIVHKKSYDILFHQLDAQNHVKIYDLCCFMQDAGADHTINIGLGLDTLQSQKSGWGWMLAHQYISFEKAAFGKNGIEVTTWSPGTERLYGIRDYLISDHQNHCIAKCSSFFLIIDLDNNKIIRPDKYLADLGTLQIRATEYSPKKMRPLDTYAHSNTYRVAHHDIDLNNHANNASIVRWMIDSIPSEATADFHISELTVSYQNQAKSGIDIISKYTILKQEEGLSIAHLICDGYDGNIVAVANSKWDAKN